MHLEVIVAVLQVSAEGGQQLDAAGGDFFGIFLLKVCKSYRSVRLTLKKHNKQYLFIVIMHGTLESDEVS